MMKDSVLTFRLAELTDARLYFDWANDPVVRENSFSPEPILWANHLKWFGGKIADPSASLLLFSFEGKPVGQIRFDREGGKAVIDISLDRVHRGMGLAVSMLKLATGHHISLFPDCRITALVHKTNPASLRTFLKAGFQIVNEITYRGIPCDSLEYIVS